MSWSGCDRVVIIRPRWAYKRGRRRLRLWWRAWNETWNCYVWLELKTSYMMASEPHLNYSAMQESRSVCTIALSTKFVQFNFVLSPVNYCRTQFIWANIVLVWFNSSLSNVAGTKCISHKSDSWLTWYRTCLLLTDSSFSVFGPEAWNILLSIICSIFNMKHLSPLFTQYRRYSLCSESFVAYIECLDLDVNRWQTRNGNMHCQEFSFGFPYAGNSHI